MNKDEMSLAEQLLNMLALDVGGMRLAVTTLLLKVTLSKMRFHKMDPIK